LSFYIFSPIHHHHHHHHHHHSFGIRAPDRVPPKKKKTYHFQTQQQTN
jgi:hypothetical protein